MVAEAVVVVRARRSISEEARVAAVARGRDGLVRARAAERVGDERAVVKGDVQKRLELRRSVKSCTRSRDDHVIVYARGRA